MRGFGGRTAVLIGGSSLATAGYGAVLPYLYSDVAQARGLGGAAAAGMFTAFALGSLATTPVAGRLADRRDPVLVAALARLGVVVAILALAAAATTATVWLAAAAYGAAVAATQPAIQVLLLAWVPEERRRDAFAWQFIGSNLALAVGGVAGGLLVDLSSAAGVQPVYRFAAAASLLSAALVWAVGRGAPALRSPVATDLGGDVGWRAVLGRPAVRRLLAVTALLTLACYAQYESGLPAYALGSLDVTPRLLGVAVAVNAVLVAVLTGPVVAFTRRHDPASLLATCAAIWIGCWLVLALPLLHAGPAAAYVVVGYAAFSFGETMLSPVLSPLAAQFAPEGAVGRTLAAVGGATTGATAVGPALSGALLALHVPAGFIALQLACCVGAIAVAGTLRASRAVPVPGTALPAPA